MKVSLRSEDLLLSFDSCFLVPKSLSVLCLIFAAMSNPHQLASYGIVAGAAALGTLLVWAARSHRQPQEDTVELDEKLQNNTFLAATLVKDLAKVGVKISVNDIRTLLQFAFIAGSGRPVNDHEMLVSHLVGNSTDTDHRGRQRSSWPSLLSYLRLLEPGRGSRTSSSRGFGIVSSIRR